MKILSPIVAVSLSLTGFGLIGCHDEGSEHGEHAAHAETAKHDEHAGHDKPAIALALNGTEKWQADVHTNKTMAEITALLSAKAPTDIKGLNTLGAGIDTLNGSLIQGCTMDGPSHENLHVLLMPLLKHTKALKTATDVKVATAAMHELHGVAGTYAKFFK